LICEVGDLSSSLVSASVGVCSVSISVGRDRGRRPLVSAVQPLAPRRLRNCWSNAGVEVDHVTVYRSGQRFTPLLADAARFARRSPGDRWFVDETYVKVNGVWRYVCRAIDRDGQVIDVLVSTHRDAGARRFFQRALLMLEGDSERSGHRRRRDLPRCPRRTDPLGLASRRATCEQSNRGRSQPAQTATSTYARVTDRLDCNGDHRRAHLLQNLRRGHYEIAVNAPIAERVAAAFAQLSKEI
jgi:IS6 family transposase